MSNLWHCNIMLLSTHMLDHISSYSWLHAAYGHKLGYTQLSLIYRNSLPLFIGTSVPYFIFSVEWNDSLGIVRILRLWHSCFEMLSSSCTGPEHPAWVYTGISWRHRVPRQPAPATSASITVLASCVLRDLTTQMCATVYLLCLAREDEHALIQQYCQTLGGESPISQPQSPAQILKSVEREERGELERIIADLEEEQRCGRPRKRKHTTFSLLRSNRSSLFSFPSCYLRHHSEVEVWEDIVGWGVNVACCSWVLLMEPGSTLAWSPFSSSSLFLLVNVFP